MTNWAMARATSGNQLVFGVGLACFPCTSAAVTVDLLLGARFARSRRACGHTGGNAARACQHPTAARSEDATAWAHRRGMARSASTCQLNRAMLGAVIFRRQARWLTHFVCFFLQ